MSTLEAASNTTVGVDTSDPYYFRILSIDGGGIKGIIPAVVINELETRLPGTAIAQGAKPSIAHFFDLIAGTSTGGIIALTLVKPDPIRGGDLVGLYQDQGHIIFPVKKIWSKNNFFDVLNLLFSRSIIAVIAVGIIFAALIPMVLWAIHLAGLLLSCLDTCGFVQWFNSVTYNLCSFFLPQDCPFPPRINWFWELAQWSYPCGNYWLWLIIGMLFSTLFMLKDSTWLRPKYSHRGLKKVLEKELSFNQSSDSPIFLSDLKKLVVVTSYDIQQRKPYMFKTTNAYENNYDNFTLASVAQATSSAPTFFAPSEVIAYDGLKKYLIDGGLVANNPGLTAYREATILFRTVIEKILREDLAKEFIDLIVAGNRDALKALFQRETAKSFGTKAALYLPAINIIKNVCLDNSADLSHRLQTPAAAPSKEQLFQDLHKLHAAILSLATQRILMVSIGCGNESEPIYYEKAKLWGKTDWAVGIINCLFDGTAWSNDVILKGLMQGEKYHNCPDGNCYFRLQHDLIEASGELDNASANNIDCLKREAVALIKQYDATGELDQIIARITKQVK